MLIPVSRIRPAAICVAALLVGVPCGAQSLGDLAKKTQEQRDKASADAGAAKAADGKDKDKDKDKDKKDKKVYTDQDLKTLTPIVGGTADADSASASAKTSPPAEASGAKAGDAPAAAAKKDEAYWRARWMPMAARIANGTDNAAAKRKRADELTLQLRQGGSASTAGRAEMIAERQRVIAEALALDEQIAEDKATLAAILEEGRRAGALPGWFR
jgi:hypothetical protein